MLNEENAIEIIVIGTATLSIVGIYALGKYEQWRDSRKSGRVVHRSFATNFARRQAALATSSGSIRKGWK